MLEEEPAGLPDGRVVVVPIVTTVVLSPVPAAAAAEVDVLDVLNAWGLRARKKATESQCLADEQHSTRTTSSRVRRSSSA